MGGQGVKPRRAPSRQAATAVQDDAHAGRKQEPSETAMDCGGKAPPLSGGPKSVGEEENPRACQSGVALSLLGSADCPNPQRVNVERRRARFQPENRNWAL